MKRGVAAISTNDFSFVSKSVNRQFSSRRTDEDVEDDSLLWRFFRIRTLLKIRHTPAIRPETSQSPALPTLGSHDLTLTSFVARTTSRCATDACPEDRSRRQVGEGEGGAEDEGVNHARVYYENRSACLRRPSPFFFFLLFGFFGRVPLFNLRLSR